MGPGSVTSSYPRSAGRVKMPKESPAIAVLATHSPPLTLALGPSDEAGAPPPNRPRSGSQTGRVASPGRPGKPERRVSVLLSGVQQSSSNKLSAPRAAGQRPAAKGKTFVFLPRLSRGDQGPEECNFRALNIY